MIANAAINLAVSCFFVYVKYRAGDGGGHNLCDRTFR
jgi:hypothetical protein